MNQHIIETLASLHSRLARLEHQTHLTGIEIPTPNLEESLSWDTIWNHVDVWKRKIELNFQNQSTPELIDTGLVIARWIVAHPGPYPETMRWGERQVSQIPYDPRPHPAVFDLILALRADGLSNDQ